jgi:hypothetical protein
MPGILRYIKENRLILIAAVFFIAWKFFLIGTLWHDRQIPPVPDDSYTYIVHIDSSLRCASFFSCSDRIISFVSYAGFDHLTYRLFFGTIGKMFDWDAATAYHASFYLGILLLVPALIVFLKTLNGEHDKRLIAFSIFILALYNGAGSYHGFFWVVPSFFVLLFFLIILRILLDDTYRHWKVSLAIIAPFYVFTHVLSLYFLIIPFLFFAIRWFLSRKPNLLLLRKISFFSAVVLCLYTPVAIHYSLYSDGNPYGPETIAQGVIDTLQPAISKATYSQSSAKMSERSASEPKSRIESLGNLFPGFSKIQDSYFRWIFPGWIGYPIFVFCIVALAYAKRLTLISLYLAALLFSIASSISPQGERSLLFLWPITFLLYGQGWWFGFQMLASRIERPKLLMALKISFVLAMVFFTAITSTYAYLWNTRLNQTRNIKTPYSTAEYLLKNLKPGEKVAYSDDMNFFDSYSFLVLGTIPSRTIDISQATYYVDRIKQEDATAIGAYDPVFRSFFNAVSKIVFSTKEKGPEGAAKTFPETIQLTEEATSNGIIVYRVHSTSHLESLSR